MHCRNHWRYTSPSIPRIRSSLSWIVGWFLRIFPSGQIARRTSAAKKGTPLKEAMNSGPSKVIKASGGHDAIDGGTEAGFKRPPGSKCSKDAGKKTEIARRWSTRAGKGLDPDWFYHPAENAIAQRSITHCHFLY